MIRWQHVHVGAARSNDVILEVAQSMQTPHEVARYLDHHLLKAEDVGLVPEGGGIMRCESGWCTHANVAAAAAAVDVVRDLLAVSWRWRW